jgi:hypothetical protein
MQDSESLLKEYLRFSVGDKFFRSRKQATQQIVDLFQLNGAILGDGISAKVLMK